MCRNSHLIVVVNPVRSSPLRSERSFLRIYQDKVGDWWASYVVQVNHESLPKNRRVIWRVIWRVIEIDWGVNEIATATDDAYDYFPHPERGKSVQGLLGRYQRQIARRRPKRGQLASNGYQRAKKEAAKTYRGVTQQVT